MLQTKLLMLEMIVDSIDEVVTDLVANFTVPLACRGLKHLVDTCLESATCTRQLVASAAADRAPHHPYDTSPSLDEARWGHLGQLSMVILVIRRAIEEGTMVPTPSVMAPPLEMPSTSVMEGTEYSWEELEGDLEAFV